MMVAGDARWALAAVPSIPRDDGGPVFRAPWEAQAFGLVLARPWRKSPAARHGVLLGTLAVADSTLSLAESVDETWPQPSILRGRVAWIVAFIRAVQGDLEASVALSEGGLGHVERALELYRGELLPDDRRFLTVQSEISNLSRLNVVLNWFEELRRRVPAAE